MDPLTRSIMPQVIRFEKSKKTKEIIQKYLDTDEDNELLDQLVEDIVKLSD